VRCLGQLALSICGGPGSEDLRRKDSRAIGDWIKAQIPSEPMIPSRVSVGITAEQCAHENRWMAEYELERELGSLGSAPNRVKRLKILMHVQHV
jgi:hypothetical protein